MPAEANADGLEATGFGHDGDSPPATGGGSLIYFTDQAAFKQLAGDLGDTGERELTLFYYLNTGNGAHCIDEPVDHRAI